jgi:hypothetical protein
MKRAALAATLCASTAAAFAQQTPMPTAGERGQAKAIVGGKSVLIDYGRPSLRGRDMLAQATVGQPWRMGAGAATSLKTETDLAFGSLTVPKGDYVLTATKIGADQWQLDFTKADKSKVVEVPLTSEALPDSVETFTIDLVAATGTKGELRMSWGKSALKTSFTAK